MVKLEAGGLLMCHTDTEKRTMIICATNFLACFKMIGFVFAWGTVFSLLFFEFLT
jgi:hypothetical protein